MDSSCLEFEPSSDLTFKLTDDAINCLTESDTAIELANGVQVVDISFEAEKIEQIKEGEKIYIYSLKSIKVKYAYDTTKEYISKVINSTSNVNNDEYRLSVTSKNVIYKSFINNGHWLVNDNFFLNNDYENASKYLTNLENAEVYDWEDFRKTFDLGETDNITQTYPGEILISTPEEFALFAYYVNIGQTYEGKTVRLTNDIDLSGKYWIPIGSTVNVKTGAENLFKGTFIGSSQVEN